MLLSRQVVYRLNVHRAYYSLYFKYKRYPPGPVGLPFLGMWLSRWNLLNYYAFPVQIARDYPQLCMYPYGPWSYGVMINDKRLMVRLSKMEQFASRPPWWSRMSPNNFPNAFTNINGSEMARRRRIFMSTIAIMTNSQFFASFVQQNIKRRILFPALERAIAEEGGKWNNIWDTSFSLSCDSHNRQKSAHWVT